MSTRGGEHLASIEAAINKLIGIARLAVPELLPDLVSAANSVSMMLREEPVRDLIVDFLQAVRTVYPEGREALRRTIADVLLREKKYWKELPEEELTKLEKLHASFEDPSRIARVHQFVGQASWEQEGETDLRPLAQELFSDQETLAQLWPWLTSGDASDAWRLGEALAKVDEADTLAERLPSIAGAGRDFRLLCGYVNIKRQLLGDQWYEQWMHLQFDRAPKPIGLIFETAWRCGVTEPIANMLIATLRTERVSPQVVGQLGFGRWGENLSVTALGSVIRTLTDRGHHETAIAILDHRIKTNPAEIDQWKPLAIELVTDAQIIRSHHMTSFYWKEVAKHLISDCARELAAAIFRAQSERKSRYWSAEHSEAAEILRLSAEADPAGFWHTIAPYLSERSDAYVFSIGFPRDVFDRIPPDVVLDWVAAQPADRAATAVKFASKDLSSDATLASRLIGLYGDREVVASAFFAEYISGAWWGPASAHWSQLAAALDEIATHTGLRNLGRWASNSAHSLREMAERDRKREEEEELRR